MTLQDQFASRPINSKALYLRMFVGAVIGLILISVFLMGADDPNPEWPKSWILRPLVFVPLAGAMGGLFLYFMEYLTQRGSQKRILAIILGVIVYIIGLFLGIVLGLDGTYWD